ncbi:MAG TPA: hypothetical protein VMB47_06610 [Candidatus Aquilonibacter sp.]|nr:hypothetical protein [Candidatus Aquilonibacter sp.]
MAATKKSASNALGDPTQSLQTFDLLDLQQYTYEKTYSTNASKDLHLFYVGRDDVHDILKYILSRVTVSLYLNMFGYDDKELNDILMAKALDAKVTMLITLDKSQTGTKTEAALIAADKAHSLSAFNTHFVVGNSSTGQISHTKGFVADGRLAAEGSTNWSVSGEGVFVLTGQPGGPGFKAQNNTQSVITDPDTVSRFTAELIAEHMAAQHAALGDPEKSSSLKSPLPAKFAPVTQGEPAASGGAEKAGRRRA